MSRRENDIRYHVVLYYEMKKEQTMNKEIQQYDDIINLSNPTSVNHPRMSLYDRAAQFAPFAALTGYDDAIRETSRLTEDKKQLDEAAVARMNEKLNMIAESIGVAQDVAITYFVPDDRKSGGAYVTCSGTVKRIDEYKRTIVMDNKTVIPIEQISDIKSELFMED